MKGLDITVFGSSLVSSYRNGACSYFRGIVRALAARGHRVTFVEFDAFERHTHRDISDPPWAQVVVVPAREASARAAVQAACGADVVVKAGGIGVFDALLEAAVLELRGPATRVGFWDEDAPATLDRALRDPEDPFRLLIPEYDFVFTRGGGDPVVRAYTALGARCCVPVHDALDPDTTFRTPPDPRFACDLAFIGNRLPDREAGVEEFFVRAAERRLERRFLIGGAGWEDKIMPVNVRRVGRVSTADHNALLSTPLAVLNVSRESMARYGFSPTQRMFEAAGAAACLITDAEPGLEAFLEPGREVLVARSGNEVAAWLDDLDAQHARVIGQAARTRVLAGHTYAQRALAVERQLTSPRPVAAAMSW